MAGLGTFVRIPRRKMAGKRLFIGVMCTICFMLGVYIKFFTRESSDQLLLANRQSVQGDDVVIKPKFHRLGAVKQHQQHEQLQQEQKQPQHEEDALNQKNDEQTFQKLEADGLQETDQHNRIHDEQDFEETKKKLIDEEVDEWEDDDHINDHHRNEEGKPETPEHIDDHQMNVDRAIERVGEVDDEEEEDALMDAGGDGGEHKEEDDEEGDDERDDEEKGEEKEGGDHSKGRGPHGIKLFDWDQWIKENEFVELGNVWGYCDDDDPPVIGKIILLEDEEKGGVKTIFVFNTTFDKDVLMGKVDISIDFNQMHFYSNTFDLPDLENEGDFFKAPIVKGDHYYVREQHISRFIPKGHYYGEGKMTDDDGRVILCTILNLHLK